MDKKAVIIQGQIVDKATKEAIPGLRVEAWDKDLEIDDLLGSAQTDEHGRFILSLDETYYQEICVYRKPDIYFKVFLEDKEIHSTKDTILWNYDNADKEVMIEIGKTLTPAKMLIKPEPGTKKEIKKEPASITIGGNLLNYNPEYKKLIFLLFHVAFKGLNDYDKAGKLSDLKKENGFTKISESMVSKNESYEITVELDQTTIKNFAEGSNLIVYAADNKGLIVGKSPLIKSTERFLERDSKRVNVTLQPIKSEAIRTDEYFRFYSELENYLPEIQIDEPRKSNKMIYVVKETGLEPDDVYPMLYAKKFVDESGKLTEEKKKNYHELFYGLIKGSNQLIGSHWDSVYSYLNNAENYLQNAIKYSYIRKDLSSKFNDFIKYLENKAVEKMLEETRDELPIKKITSFALSDKNKRKIYLTQKAKFKGDLASFHENLIKENKLSTKEIKAIEFATDLADLTDNYVPLMEKFKAGGERTKITDLLKLSREELIEEVSSVDLPEDLVKDKTESNEEELKKKYALKIVRGLESRFPSEVALKYAKEKPDLVGEQRAANITTFFKKMEDTKQIFNLKEHKVSDYEFENEVKELKPAVIEDIKALQRVASIAPDFETSFKLLNKGIRSAYQVANVPNHVFCSNFGGAFENISEAEEFMYKSEDVSFYLENIAVLDIDIGSSTVTQMAGSKLLTDVPRDFCECEHCRSIYGPAAFFVELMQFLRNFETGALDVGDEYQKPLLELLKRRPDLQHIELSCKNTSTLIPHIDLVNEILEDIVVYGSLKKSEIESHTHANLHVPHETGESTSEELLATPQHTLSPAYRALSSVKYPASLPYHQPLDTIHTYLDNLKTSRYDLMDMTNSRLNSATIATLSAEQRKEYNKKRNAISSEYLHLNEETFKILTDKNFNEDNKSGLLKEFYGYANVSNATFEKNIVKVREFLRRTDIKFTDLMEIVKTTYINPHLHLLEALNNIVKPVTSGNLLDPSTSYSISNDEYDLIMNVSIASGSDYESMPSTFIKSDPAILGDMEIWLNTDSRKSDIGRIITIHQDCDLPEEGKLLDYMSINYIKKIYGGEVDDDLFNTTFTKLYKFIRLWKKLGWTIHELDLAITALMDKNEDYFYPEFIKKLSTVQQIKDLTNLTVEKILCFWSKMNSRGENSLYKKLFLSKSISRLDTGFALDENNKLPPDKMGLHIVAIQAAYRISDGDFNLINKDIGIDISANNSFNIDNLTKIYRYVLLAKGFGISIKDVVHLKSLCQIDPCGDWNNEYPLLDFIKHLDLIKSSDFKIADLAKICGYDSSTDIQDDQIVQWIVETKEQLLNIHEEYKNPEKDDIIEKTSIVTRFEQAISSKFLDTILEAFKNIEDASEAEIRQLFDGIFTNHWTEPVIPPEEYNMITDMDKQKAYKITLRNNALYRYVLNELNNIIKPTILSETFYAKLTQLLGIETELIQQLFPAEQNNILNKKITDNGLDIITEAIGGNNVYKIQTFIHAPENRNYVISVKTKKDLNSVKMSFDNEEIQTQPIALDQEVSFTARDLNPDNYYSFYFGSNSEITKNDIEIFWKKDNKDKELINEIYFYSSDIINVYKKIKDLIIGLDRASDLIEGFGLTVHEVSHFQRRKEQFNDIDFLSINYSQWKRINQYIQLRRLLPVTEKTLLAYFDIADKGLDKIQLLNELLVIMGITPNDTENEDEVENQLKEHFKASLDDYPVAAFYLAYVTGWNIDDIFELLRYEDKDTNSDSLTILQNEEVASGFIPKIRMTKAIGINIAQLLAWGKVITETEDNSDVKSFDKLQTIADNVKLAVKSKYDDDSWFDIARQLNDKIRENQQSALVAYLLVEQGLEHPDQLYEYYLLDVQMKSQRETTRIKQAILSIQLFVQRCLLNLEKDNGVGVDILNRSRWDWIKNYRVWEANKKVFVNPENWLEPELRYDKSPFFKELESELMQNDITKDTVETALKNYLTKLDQVARLDVCGLYDDVENSTEYIFARTSNAPYTYYFRTKKYSSVDNWAKYKDQYWRWSPWEEVKVDIDTIEDGEKNGEKSWLHLMPVVWKGRLMIFWPVFREKSKSPTTGTDISARDLADQKTSDLEAIKYWEIHLAWSEYKDNKWSKKQISSEFITTETERKIEVGIIPRITQDEIDDEILNAFNYFKKCDYEYENSLLRTGIVPIYCSDDEDNDDSPKEVDGYTYWRKRYNYDTPDTWPPEDENYDLPTIEHRSFDRDKPETWFDFDNDGCQPYFKFNRIPDDKYEIEKFSSVILNTIKDNGICGKPRLNGEGGAKDWIDGEDRWFNVDRLEREYNVSILRAKEDAERELKEAEEILKGAIDEYIKAINLTVKDEEKIYETVRTRHKQPWEFSFKTAIDEDENLRIDLFGGLENSGFLLTSLHDRPQIHALPPINDRHVANFYNCEKLLNSLNGVLDNVDNGMNVGQHDYDQIISHYFIFQDNNRKYYVLKRLHPHFDLRFFNFYHPLVNEFIKKLNKKGINAFFELETQLLDKRCEYNLIPFKAIYDPDERVWMGYPKETVEFLLSRAYACYNWELFFHVPLFIATHLSKNNKFKEARDWFHFILDPTSSEKEEEKRIWRFLPFREEDENENDLKMEGWRDFPFQPHFYAQMRGTKSYKLNVIMKYLDNLIAWGDMHFRRYSMESLGEATQLYVMASLLLGPRPEFIPERGEINPETYFSIMDRLDRYTSNVERLEYELAAPFSGNIEIGEDYNTAPGNILGYGIGKYFCIPFNSKLLEYWNIVEERLYNIRHGLDINGIRRSLALFEPELDPGMLVSGAASGLSIAGMLGQLNAPIPYYRFGYMVQKAIEICSDIKALGSNLLSAIEKHDAEELSLRRSAQELDMLNLVKQVKQLQRDESAEALEGLKISRVATAKRMKHYLDLLGIEESEDAIPDEEAVELTEIEPDVDLSLVEVEGVEGLKLIPMEKADLDLSEASHYLQLGASGMEMIATIMNLIPSFSADGKPLGIGAGVSIGGSNFGAAVSAFSRFMQIGASHLSYSAARASKIGSYFRREQDWVFQANMVGRELIQMNSQLKAAQMRLEIAEKELVNHDRQIENAEQTDEFLRSKFSNNELYTWMKNRLTDIYKQSFDMAFDLAKKAERSYQFERGEYNTNFIQYNYWNSAKEGLLAGESLYLALRQMEKSFLDKNKRELEITKNISLLRLNPEELLKFKLTGTCEFELPEVLFDMDFPGHYMRRIKSISLTIPCVVGPYTSINCTLRQLKNEIRLVNTAGEYQRNQDGDNRFMVNYASTQSVATSRGQNDSGLFELNFRDERYLPFEGSGVISRWRLEMETGFPQFDFNTISDIILTINYTARDGGETLKTLAREHLFTYASAQSGPATDQGGFFRAFNLKQEFSSEWHQLKTSGEATFNIGKNLLPYFSAISENIALQKATWFVKSISGNIDVQINGTVVLSTASPGVQLGDYKVIDFNSIVFGEDFAVNANKDDIEEIIVIIKYTQ